MKLAEQTENLSGGGPFNDHAFARLMATHAGTLARYIRFRIASASDAEDVLQETLVAIWIGLRRVRDPALLPAWMLQVAQNRCRDYFRARPRRETPLDDTQLHYHADRFGLRQYRQAHRFVDVLDALESVPQAARDAARHYYLDGLTIAEIAAGANRPVGTVKRQLFVARQSMRAALGVRNAPLSSQPEKITMTSQTIADATTARPPFPLTRPAICITELPDTPFAVDCRELRSWPIIPAIGEEASAAEYSLPGWQLDEVTSLHALHNAEVHGVGGVEISVRVWKPDSSQEASGTLYARLTETRTEFLAVHIPQDDSTVIETFLDHGFAENWGSLQRSVADQGFLTRTATGDFLLAPTAPLAPGTGIGGGLTRVDIGARSFVCLRILESPTTTDLDSDDCLNIAYLTREGRTVLVRRYCRPRFVDAARFPVLLDEAAPLTLNGVTLHHWYDILTDIAL